MHGGVLRVGTNRICHFSLSLVHTVFFFFFHFRPTVLFFTDVSAKLCSHKEVNLVIT
eukprot:m.167939 g.167939  ORF g.167939 m.167939 type:complete len:57 (-) comp10351_c0_seq1:47-217(-)